MQKNLTTRDKILDRVSLDESLVEVSPEGKIALSNTGLRVVN